MGFSAYIPAGDFGRVCDVCGRLRPGKGFRVVENLWICDRHPSYVPRQSLERVPYVELGAPKPIPSAKPLNLVDSYEVAEAQILELMAYAPSLVFDVSVSGRGAPFLTSAQTAGLAGIYLYDIIADARRPARWVTFATALLRTHADWLVTRQRGGPAIAGFASSDVQWGGYTNPPGGSTDNYFPADSAVGGLALLRAYQVFGSQKYLDAARACAWFVRGAQCGDKLASRPSSTDAAGASPHHYGTWTHRIALTAGTYDFDHRYYAFDFAVALEFLTAYMAVVGDETIGSATTTAVFSSSRAALVSTAIAEAGAFWRDGAFSVDDGAVVVGLSSSTPREFYDAYPSNKGLFTGRGSWQFNDGALSVGTNVTSLGWALAIRALRAAGDPLATTLFDWLMTFTSNPAFEVTSSTHTYGQVTFTSPNDRALFAGIAGTYNPRVAPATLLQVRSAGSAVAVNGSSLYSLGAAGALAALYSSRQPTAFAGLKDALSTPRPRWRDGFDPRDGQYLYLGLLGVCGLSFQPYTSPALLRQQSVGLAAIVGGVYRFAPQAYTARGHA